MKLPSEIEPEPGVGATAILRTLRQVHTDLSNLRGGSGNFKQRVVQYQEWSNQAAQSLSYTVSAESVEHLILTPRHWVLQQWTHVPNSGDPIRLVETECVDRLKALERVVAELCVIEERAESLESDVIAPDTNFFLHYEESFDSVDWLGMVGVQRLCILVPSVVVRELDKHKRAAKNIKVSDTNDQPVRTRARVSLRRLRELFANDPTKPVDLMPGVTIELLLDTVRHSRIDDPDSEIIDRLLAAQSLLSRSIALVTCDRSMEFAARPAGLGTISIPEPAEPAEGGE